MNVKILILLCLVTILLIPDADAFWSGRRRRRWNPFKLVCSMSCKFKACQYTWVHDKLDRVCKKTCSNVCRKIFGKKRDEESREMIQDEPVQGKPVIVVVPLPSRLSAYDTNKDGRISKAEFVAIQPRDSDAKSTASAFDTMDKNGDTYIDCKEFLSAKIDYESKPKC